MKNGTVEGLQVFDSRTLNMLFSQINPILSNDVNYGCLIIDEAQRLQQSYKEGNVWKREIIKELVDKSKNVVLL